MTSARGQETVLVTGFPAFRARKLVDALLADENLRIVLVVRPKLLVDARTALAERSDAERARVEVFAGDAAHMDFGLSGEEYVDLARRVQRIFHFAEATYLGVSERDAIRTNVGGAKEIVEFAKVCEDLRLLVYQSSAFVCGGRSGLVLEEQPGDPERARNVVERTKARAERIIRSKMDEIPTLIIRPGIVVGDSRTGEIDRFDGPYLLVLLMLTTPPDVALPLPGRGDVPLHLVPVDYVVDATLALSRLEAAVGRTVHLVDPAPLSARRVFELVAAAGGRRMPRGFIPANISRALLRTPGLERIASSPRSVVDAFTTPVEFSTATARELLAEANLSCPRFESYVERLVSFAEERLKERRDKNGSAALAQDDPLL